MRLSVNDPLLIDAYPRSASSAFRSVFLTRRSAKDAWGLLSVGGAERHLTTAWPAANHHGAHGAPMTAHQHHACDLADQHN